MQREMKGTPSCCAVLFHQSVSKCFFPEEVSASIPLLATEESEAQQRCAACKLKHQDCRGVGVKPRSPKLLPAH